MLELMARSGMRVGEVLKLTLHDIDERKVIIRDPKSGQEAEVAFLPQKVADRLKKYISDNEIKSGNRIFPMTYAAARIVVKKAGELVGIIPGPDPSPKFSAILHSYSGNPPTMTDLNHVAPGRAETP